MTYKLGKGTRRNLIGVHPRLVEAVELAVTLTKQDFCVIPGGGLRGQSEADANAAKGVGVSNSLHLRQADGYGHAVDLVAYEGGKPTWGKNDADRKRLYVPIAEAMTEACHRLGVLVQHGADWDMDGIRGELGEWDWPHWQLPKLPHRIEQAQAALRGWQRARDVEASHA